VILISMWTSLVTQMYQYGACGLVANGDHDMAPFTLSNSTSGNNFEQVIHFINMPLSINSTIW